MAATSVTTPMTSQQDVGYRHLREVTCSLERLWRRGLYTDLTLVAEGETLRCHRLLLAAASPYFHSRLGSGGRKERGSDTLHIQHVTKDTLLHVLHFVYTGQCLLTRDNAEPMLRAATIFHMTTLKDVCDAFLRHHVQLHNAVRWYKLARATDSAETEGRAREVILKHLQQLWPSRLFRQLTLQELMDVLRHRDGLVQVSAEEDPVVRSSGHLGKASGDLIYASDGLGKASDGLAEASDDTVKASGDLLKASEAEDAVLQAVVGWVSTDHRRKRFLLQLLRQVHLTQVSEDLLGQVLQEEEVVKEDCRSTLLIQQALRQREKTAVRQNPQQLHGDVPSPSPASEHCQEREVEEVLVLVGGVVCEGGGFRSSQQNHAYSLRQQRWCPLPAPPLPSDSGSACCLHAQHVYVSGAGPDRRGLLRYDMLHHCWTQLPPMGSGRRGHSLVALGGALYVLGGLADGHGASVLSPRSPRPSRCSVIERYDLQQQSWRVAGALAEPVWAASAVAFQDKIRVFGGFQGRSRAIALVQTFDPASASCKVTSQLPLAVGLSRAVVSERNTVVILCPSGHLLTSSDCLVFRVSLTLPNFKRSFFGMAVQGRRLFVAGGRQGDRVCEDMLVVDLQHCTLLQLPDPLPGPVWGGALLHTTLTTTATTPHRENPPSCEEGHQP